jgi:PPOX class probable F420-dependent enzyme
MVGMPSPLPEPLVERLLASWPVARLGTVAADGRPHLVPVVFAWHGAALWTPLDGKPKRRTDPRSLARVRHLARDPRASLLLDHYEDAWQRLWWIRVDGRGALVAATDGAIEALRAKYPQYARVRLFGDGGDAGGTGGAGRLLIRLDPERVTSWYGGELPSAGP